MTEEAASTTFVRVWLGRRFVGLLVDWLIFVVLWTAASTWTIGYKVPQNIPTAPNPDAFLGEMFVFLSQLAWNMAIITLLVFAYFVILETWRGATLGKKLVGIKTIDLANPGNTGLPFGKAFKRELIKVVGFIPGLIFLVANIAFFSNVAAGTIPLELVTPMLAFLGPLQFVARILPFVWLAWICISLLRKRDPIYDRLARTAVVRA